MEAPEYLLMQALSHPGDVVVTQQSTRPTSQLFYRTRIAAATLRPFMWWRSGCPSVTTPPNNNKTPVYFLDPLLKILRGFYFLGVYFRFFCWKTRPKKPPLGRSKNPKIPKSMSKRAIIGNDQKSFKMPILTHVGKNSKNHPFWEITHFFSHSFRGGSTFWIFAKHWQGVLFWGALFFGVGLVNGWNVFRCVWTFSEPLNAPPPTRVQQL